MRLAIMLVVAASLTATANGWLLGATPPKPAPGKPAANAPCADRFSEATCKERSGCRWIEAHKRQDGTFATAYCLGGRAR
jgi:hypothetical protein